MENKVKQKQIEEMAREIAKRDCYLYDKCPKRPQHNCVSQDPEIMLQSSKNYITIATWLVEACYRKIPEGAVMVTSDEFWKLSNKFSKKELDEIVEFHKNKTRKETAKKFKKLLKALVAERNCNEDYDWEDVQVDGQIFIECVDEICKEIAEGKV